MPLPNVLPKSSAPSSAGATSRNNVRRLASDPFTADHEPKPTVTSVPKPHTTFTGLEMRHLNCAAAAAFLSFSLCEPVAAQTPAHDDEPPAIGFSFGEDTLKNLPLGGNVYALLETTQPEVIADRFNSGGLNVGEPSRVGGFLGSWSQTLFRIGDVDVSDPAGSGASLLFPET